VKDDAGAYGLHGIVVAVGPEGIEAAGTQFDKTEIHNGQDGNVYSSETHVFKVVMERDAVAVQKAVVGAADTCGGLQVGLEGMEKVSVKHGADAEQRGVDSGAAAVVVGECAPLGIDDATAQVGSKLDRADLEEVVVDAGGATEGRDVVVDGTRGRDFRRGLEVAQTGRCEGSIDAELGLNGGGGEGSDGQKEECFAQVHVASSLPAEVF
jgi:predicted neutral ceramidase superfamily lipid hydrolase